MTGAEVIKELRSLANSFTERELRDRLWQLTRKLENEGIDKPTATTGSFLRHDREPYRPEHRVDSMESLVSAKGHEEEFDRSPERREDAGL